MQSFIQYAYICVQPHFVWIILLAVISFVFAVSFVQTVQDGGDADGDGLPDGGAAEGEELPTEP